MTSEKWSWWSLWIFQYFLARYLSYPDSLQLGWYTVLTRNNSSWVFSEPEKEVWRYTIASRRKSFIFLHVVKEEQRGVMDIWCTSGLRRVRRDPSITRGGLDADQWCVRLSMRSPTVYGKKICRGDCSKITYRTDRRSGSWVGKGRRTVILRYRQLQYCLEIS
jgi:hypothetical protein